MYEILKALAAANGLFFEYGRHDFNNLHEAAEQKNVSHIFLDPVKIRDIDNDSGVTEQKNYSGSFMILLSSDIDEKSYNDRYQDYIKPIVIGALKTIKDSIRCNYEPVFVQWETIEVINIFDFNFDGIICTYQLTIDADNVLNELIMTGISYQDVLAEIGIELLFLESASINFGEVIKNDALTSDVELIHNYNFLGRYNLSLFGTALDITKLIFDNSKLVSLDLSKLIALEYLDLNTNGLPDISISELTELTYLDLSNNNILSADIDNIIQLLDIFGKSNGTLLIATGNEVNTEVSNDSVTNLVAKGWSVDVSYLGPELHTNANAASDPAGNEVDAITGFTPQGSGFLLTSQSIIKSTGGFAIKAEATGGNGSRFYADLDAAPFSLVIGKKYQISFDSRHLGSGGNWKFMLDSSNILATGTILKDLINVDILFSKDHLVFTHSVNTKWFGAREFSALSDGGVYADDISFREVL